MIELKTMEDIKALKKGDFILRRHASDTQLVDTVIEVKKIKVLKSVPNALMVAITDKMITFYRDKETGAENCMETNGSGLSFFFVKGKMVMSAHTYLLEKDDYAKEVTLRFI